MKRNKSSSSSSKSVNSTEELTFVENLAPIIMKSLDTSMSNGLLPNQLGISVISSIAPFIHGIGMGMSIPTAARASSEAAKIVPQAAEIAKEKANELPPAHRNKMGLEIASDLIGRAAANGATGAPPQKRNELAHATKEAVKIMSQAFAQLYSRANNQNKKRTGTYFSASSLQGSGKVPSLSTHKYDTSWIFDGDDDDVDTKKLEGGAEGLFEKFWTSKNTEGRQTLSDAQDLLILNSAIKQHNLNPNMTTPPQYDKFWRDSVLAYITMLKKEDKLSEEDYLNLVEKYYNSKNNTVPTIEEINTLVKQGGTPNMIDLSQGSWFSPGKLGTLAKVGVGLSPAIARGVSTWLINKHDEQLKKDVQSGKITQDDAISNSKKWHKTGDVLDWATRLALGLITAREQNNANSNWMQGLAKTSLYNWKANRAGLQEIMDYQTKFGRQQLIGQALSTVLPMVLGGLGLGVAGPLGALAMGGVGSLGSSLLNSYFAPTFNTQNLPIPGMPIKKNEDWVFKTVAPFNAEFSNLTTLPSLASHYEAERAKKKQKIQDEIDAKESEVALKTAEELLNQIHLYQAAPSVTQVSAYSPPTPRFSQTSMMSAPLKRVVPFKRRELTAPLAGVTPSRLPVFQTPSIMLENAPGRFDQQQALLNLINDSNNFSPNLMRQAAQTVSQLQREALINNRQDNNYVLRTLLPKLMKKGTNLARLTRLANQQQQYADLLNFIKSGANDAAINDQQIDPTVLLQLLGTQTF